MAKDSVTERIKVRKSGKLARRKMAQDHFRARKSGGQIQSKRGGKLIDRVDIKNIKRYL